MRHPSRWLARVLACTIFWAPFPALAEDIDIFTGGSIAATNPNILFVLDNTSNWARQNQQWPGGLTQGQAEANAIKTLINDASVISSAVNVGVMEFVTAGNANNTGGFVRFPILPMDATNKAALSTKLTTIYNDINGVNEKRNSGTEYGNLIYDVYNYLTGGNTYDSLNPPNPDADSRGYTTAYSQFKTPLTADNGCGRTFMVFIGNPNASGPTSDSAANKTTLGNLGCDTTNVSIPNFSTQTVTQQNSLGTGVYASQAACEAAAAAAHGATYESYSCTLSVAGTTTTTLSTSVCGQYASQGACIAAATAAHGATYSSYSCDVVAACNVPISLGTSNCGVYNSVAACEAGLAAAYPELSSHACVASASLCGAGPIPLGTTSCGQYATQAACQLGAATTWPGYETYTCSSVGACTSLDLDGNACYASAATCQNTVLTANPGYNSVSCTSATSCNQSVTTCAGASAYNTDAKCDAAAPGLLGATYPSYTCSSGSNCAGGKTWTITGVAGTNSYSAIATGTRWSVTGTEAAIGSRYDMSATGGNTYTVKGHTVANTYNIFGNYSASISVPTGTYSSSSNMWMADEWARCLHQKDLSPDGTPAVAEAFTADFSTSGAIVGDDTVTFDGVTTTLATGDSTSEIARKVKESVYPNWTTSYSGSVVTFTRMTTGAVADVVTGDFVIVDDGSTGTKPVVVVTTTTQGAAATGGALGMQNVTTYTIDVYNAQQNSEHTGLMMSMAQQGGGRYFAAKSEAQILAALKQIISEIQSVNTAFAAASIPLSTTNRSQNLNEVYIGVFRPSLEPRWFGNLKKFKIGTSATGLDLVDSLGTTALNSQTGFLNDCATSFWTTDSGDWWDQVKIGGMNLSDNALINPVPKSTCVAMPAANTSTWSDLPDGQSVEKGSVASVIRRGNNPPATATTPTWQVNRSIYTRSGGALVALTDAALGSTNLYDYVRGVDINVDGSHVAEKTLDTPIANAVRASVHGDVVHSRPLAVNYGANDTVIYYGANDGMLRAVDGATGKEKWAFIPAEFLDATKQTRLMQNTPLVAYGATPVAGSSPKNYMFDGSPGLYQSAGNTKVWLFPSQRRGGRMIHALDVTNNSVPSLKWYQGCPNLADDVGCTSGFEDMGQTWSVPIVTKIKGFHASTPVVVVGGGYDDCEDARPATTPPTWACDSAKGRAVFVLNADTGELLKKFTFTGMRGVTAGVSFVDVNSDGYSDFAYVVDLGGALYRLSFVSDATAAGTALGKDDWTIKKIAYASNGRKLMFTPAVAYAGGSTVYVAMGSGDRERPLIGDYPYAQDIQNYVYTFRDTIDAATCLTADDCADYVAPCHLDGDPSAAGSCVLDYTDAGAACGSPSILPGDSGKKAWRVGFVYQGEQAVTQPLILGGMVTVNTTRPVPAGVCSAALGEGGGYFLNLLNGSGAIGVSGTCGGSIRGSFTGVGLPTDPVVVNLPGEDPICIGCVSKSNTNPTVGSKLFEPTPIPPPITKRKFRKYRYMLVD